MFNIDQFNEYFELRKSILSGNLFYLKSELIHVLYKVFLIIIKPFFKNKLKKNNKNYFKELKKIIKLSYDFQNYSFYKELKYLINSINDYNFINFKKDKYIFNYLDKNHYILLSKYAYASLIKFLIYSNLKIIEKTLFFEFNVQIYNITNLFEESYLNNIGINTYLNYIDIKEINSKSIIVGMLREDFNLIQKLDDLYIRKHSKKQIYNNKFLKNDYKRYPVGKASNSLLKNTPEYKDKYKNDFSKDYLNKYPIELKENINILKIELNDKNFEINVIEISKDFNLIILGYNCGKIKLYDLSNNDNYYYNNLKNEDLDEEKENLNNKNDTKTYSKNFVEKKIILGNTRINYLDDNIFVDEKIKIINFFGHSSSIISIKINYDNNYFISGDLEGDIRLWNPKINNCLGIYKIHIKNIWDLDLSSKGYNFLSCSEDGNGYLWNLKNINPIKNFSFNNTIPKICKITNNLLYGLFATFDNSIYLFNLEDTWVYRFFQNPVEINILNINYNGDTLFLGNNDGSISILNLENLILIKNIFLDKSKNPIRNLNLSVDENFLIITNKNNISFYKMNDMRNIQSINIFEKYNIDNSYEKSSIKPFKSFINKSLDIINSFTNNQNLAIFATRLINN